MDVSIEWNGLPCATRCSYCRNCSGDAPLSGVSYERARDIALRFSAWLRDAAPGVRVSFEIGHSYEIELGKLVDFLQFPLAQGRPAWDRLALNGLRLRSRAELDELFAALRRAGLAGVDLAFFGVGDSHDSWAGRPGDYEYLVSMARSMSRQGLTRGENIVLRKTTLHELPDLLRMLDTIPGLVNREPNLMDHFGRGRLVDDERLDESDLAILPQCLGERIDRRFAKTESDWRDASASGRLSFTTKRYCLVPVTNENVDRLEREDCAATIESIVADERERREREPPLDELAARCGDAGCAKLYALRDVVWKWRGKYYLETAGAIPAWLDWRDSTVRTKYTPETPGEADSSLRSE